MVKGRLCGWEERGTFAKKAAKERRGERFWGSAKVVDSVTRFIIEYVRKQKGKSESMEKYGKRGRGIQKKKKEGK